LTEANFLKDKNKKKSFLYNINPAIKLIILIIFTIFVVTTKSYELNKFILYLLLIILLIIISKISIKKIILNFLNILPFLVIVSLSILFKKSDELLKINFFNLFTFYIRENLLNFFSMLFKSSLSIIFLTIIILTTEFNFLIKSLEKLCIPKFFILTIFFVYRYLFVLSKEIKRIEIARDSRYFGGAFIRQIKVYANIIAVFLLRSIERSERIYYSMLSRCYDGNIRSLYDLEFSKKDIIFSFIFVSIILLIKLI
jgi:cobalt/nickel transport system permease protein